MRTARNVAIFLIKVQFFYTKNAILPTKCGVSEEKNTPCGLTKKTLRFKNIAKDKIALNYNGYN